MYIFFLSFFLSFFLFSLLSFFLSFFPSFFLFHSQSVYIYLSIYLLLSLYLKRFPYNYFHHLSRFNHFSLSISYPGCFIYLFIYLFITYFLILFSLPLFLVSSFCVSISHTRTYELHHQQHLNGKVPHWYKLPPFFISRTKLRTSSQNIRALRETVTKLC